MPFSIPQAPLWLICVFGAVQFWGCGDNLLPALRIADSHHFRLWMDLEVRLPEGVTPDTVLSELENNWIDMHGFFAMPDAKIDYYWLTNEHITSACGVGAAACQRGGMVVTNTYRPDHHELNHAYLGLRRPSPAIPFLAEGAANALGCSQQAWTVTDAGSAVSWRSVVTAGGREDRTHRYGARFVHFLVTKYGIEAFVDYYVQAPVAINADVFAENYAAFWSQDLDADWAEMLTLPADRLASALILPICPCSLPPMDLDGGVHPEQQRNDYWRLPDVAADTIELTSDFDQLLRDCAGETTVTVAPVGQTRSREIRFGPLLMRLPESHYVSGQSLRGRRGRFLSGLCENTEPYDIPTDQAFGEIKVVASFRETEAETLFMNFRTSTPRNFLSAIPLKTCPSCDFDSPNCVTRPGGGFLPVSGSSYVRMGPIGQTNTVRGQGTIELLFFED